MNKEEVCIIRSKLKNDYVYDALSHYGYQILTPYRGNSLFFRIIREIWFRCHFPFRSLWFRRPEKGKAYHAILMFDPLIMTDYIEWIHDMNPESRIILTYENRADRTINPNSVPSYVEKWSYDGSDCEKYSMNFNPPSFFMEYKRIPNNNPKYDVLYLGRDKGRAEMLFELERKFNEHGLKTYFYICADRQYLRFKKKYYKKLLSYEDYLDLMRDSRSILNILPDGQKSITQREMEAVVNGVKCITNNKGILESEFYDPSVYFVLGHDDLSDIESFMKREVKALPSETLAKYDFHNNIEMMLNNSGCSNQSE